MRKIFSTLILIVVGIFSAIAQITLTATLGTTGPTSYTTLKEAFDAVNLGAHQGLITIQVTASTSEAASAVLNASGNGLASYTSITIYPTSSGLSISGNLAAPLIDFNSADFVTIDGRVDQTGTTPDLTIMNTSTSNVAATSTIRFIVDACDNTIKYCNLKGATTATTGGILYFAAGNLDQGSDRMIIEYNNFTGVDASNRPSYALYSYGTSGRNNSDNLIRYNNFYDVWSKTMSSASVFWDLYSSYNTVSYNNFYETSTADLFNGGTYYFIELGNSQNGSIINNNYLGGTAANCGGSALVKSNTSSCTFYGIYVKVGNSKATEIQGNTIQNIDWGNSSSNHFYGIYLNSGTVNVGTTTGNLIGKTDINGSINLANATSSSNFFGIYVDGATSVVKNNTIAGITASNTDPANSTHFAGIYKTGSGSFTCQYNTIGSSSISNSCYASSASAGNGQNVVGIEVRGTGANNVSGNTISNLTNGTTNSDPATLGYTRGIYIYDGTNTVSNNTISKLKISNADNSSTSTVSVGGIVVAQPTGATQNIYGNTVSDLSNTYATFVGYIIGIYIDANTNTYNIYNNFVTSLSVTASTGNMIGIKLRRGNGTFYNNVISVGENSASNVYGIFESGAAVTELSKWYFNKFISKEHWHQAQTNHIVCIVMLLPTPATFATIFL
jgi:hypothetical protein